MSLPNIQIWCERLTQRHVILILTFLGLLAYANAVNHPFVHDDIVFIQRNPDLAELDLRNFFLQTSVPEHESPIVNRYYRPLLELTNRILYRIAGLNPHGFHFFNILLHIINSFCVYKVMALVTGHKKKLSLALAVLFLLHPVQSEAVACISGISNLVFAFLCLFSFYWYARFTHGRDGRHGALMYWLSLTAFFLALLAKEQSVVLPFLIAAYELCFAKKSSGAFDKKCRPVAGFFSVLAGYFILRKLMFGFTVMPSMAGSYEFSLILLAIPRSLLTYTGLVLFPRELHYYRSQDILLPYMGPILLFSVIAVAAVVLTVRTPKPRRQWMAFGLCWFFVSLLPTLNIIPLINEYTMILTAEHFLYFPIIGLLLFAAGIFTHWMTLLKYKNGFAVSFMTCAILGFTYMGITIRQNTYWRSEIALFERTLKYEKDFGRVRFLLAKAYASEGRFQEAAGEDRKALAIMQGYLRKVANPPVQAFYEGFIKQIHFHLGQTLDRLGDTAGSLEHFKNAAHLDPDNELYHYAAGIAYVKAGDIPNAARHFEKIVALNENNLLAVNNLALCYQELGETAKAQRLLQTVAAKDSGSVSAQRNLEEFLKNKRTGDD